MKKINEEIYLSLVIVSIFSYNLFENVLAGAFNKVGLRDINLASFVVNAIYIFIIINALRFIFKRFTIDMLIIIIFFIISIIISYIFFPYNRIYILNNIGYLFYFCLPGYLACRSIKNAEILSKVLYKMAYCLIILGVIWFFGYSIKDSSYEMTFSYQVLPAILILLDNFFKKLNIIDLVFSLIGISIIIISGSRGALLCLATFILLYIILGNLKKVKKVMFLSVILISAEVIYRNMNELLIYLINFLNSKNILSRTLEYLYEGKMNDLSLRDTIWNRGIELVKSNPIMGYGIYGDRFFVDSYIHNLFLELLIHYGIILGSIIILIITALIILSLSKSVPFEWKRISIVFISYAFVASMLSGSYLETPNILMMLGIIVNIFFMRKNIKKKVKYEY